MSFFNHFSFTHINNVIYFGKIRIYKTQFFERIERYKKQLWLFSCLAEKMILQVFDMFDICL